MPPVRSSPLRLALFAVALGLAYVATHSDADVVDQALMWLPSGVATAGLLLLGRRAVWLVALVAFGWRVYFGQPWHMGAAAACGASLEALLGVWLLRALRVEQGCARLRDLAAVLVAAAVAPFGSMAVTVVARYLVQGAPIEELVVGMTGWWRMNAIGVLAALPLALSWPGARARRTQGRVGLHALAAGAATTAATVALLLLPSPGPEAIVLLGLIPTLAFLAALHSGSLAATASALAGVVTVAIVTGHGDGPFLWLDIGSRHTVAQMVLVGISVISPLFAVLLSERDANAARWLRIEGVGQALLRMLPDACYRLDQRGRVLDAVRGADDDGDHRRDVVGEPFAALVPADARAAIEACIEQARRDGSAAPVEHRVVTASGRRDREVRFVRLPNDHVLAVVRDITERKRTARQLLLQASVLEMIAAGRGRQQVFEAIVQGLEALVPDCAASIMLLHGRRLHFTIGPSLPPDYAELADGLEIGDDAGACGAAAHLGRTVVCADLTRDPRWRAYRGVVARFGLGACWSVPIRGGSGGGAVLGTIALYHDAPREPQPFEVDLVERAAVLCGLVLDRERREGLLGTIHETATEGLFRCVPGESFAYLNAAFARMFGYESDDDMRRRWRDADDEGHRRSVEELLHTTASVRGRKLELQRRDGSRFWALLSTNVVFDDLDAELLCDGTLTDVTEFVELEDRLRQAQKMEAVGQLAGGVAHDFNNLLTAMRGYAESIAATLAQHDLPPEDVDQVLLATERASSLTRQLLAFGRQQMLMPEVLELREVVGRMGDMCRRLIGPHIDLDVAPGDDSIRARVDRGQLEQVVLNLVINARDAMPEGGLLEIELADVHIGAAAANAPLPAGRYAALRVRDDGVGMAPEVVARAFDPFYTTKAPGAGTGLGLSTVYGIVKQSGGEVSIDSEVGRGTCVTVHLPFAEELPANSAPAQLPRRDVRAGCVLLVEDEPIVLAVARRALQQAGHEVIDAEHGERAIELFERHRDRIDLVLTDLSMPRMGGIELVQRLRAEAPGLRVLLMSGYSPDAVDSSWGRDPLLDFVHKPFTAADLQAQVAAMLAGRAGTGPVPRTNR